VSLLSIDRLNAAFSPNGLELTRARGWWRQHCVDRITIPVPPTGGAHGWQSTLSAMQAALENSQWRGLPMWITLSDRLVRYQLLPWLPQLAAPSERGEYARFHFRQVFGTVAENWDIRVDTSLAGMPALACAVDKDLLLSLTELANSAGNRISNIVPRFASVVNRIRTTFQVIEDEVSALALFESGGLTIAILDGDRWKSVRQRFVTTSPADCLRSALEQEQLVADSLPSVTSVYLLGCNAKDKESIEKIDTRWSFKYLDIPSPLAIQEGK